MGREGKESSGREWERKGGKDAGGEECEMGCEERTGKDIGEGGQKTEGKRRKGGEWSGGDGRKGFVVHGENRQKCKFDQFLNFMGF